MKLTTVVFDKTGTLTKGEPTVTDVVVPPGDGHAALSTTEVLRLAAAPRGAVMSTHRHVHRRATAVMWAGIASSALPLVVLLARGGGADPWGIAAGVLLLICIGVCVWAGHHGRMVRAHDPRTGRPMMGWDRVLDCVAGDAGVAQ